MKITIEIDTESEDFEKEELTRLLKSLDMTLAISDMWEYLFRPAFKHGYSGAKLEKLLNMGEMVDENGDSTTIGLEIVDELSKIYNEILRDRGIVIDDLLR